MRLYKLDGKPYAGAGPQGPTAPQAQRLLDARTVKATTTADGKVVASFTQTVSSDGKTLTYTFEDPQGQPTGRVQVYDKQ